LFYYQAFKAGNMFIYLDLVIKVKLCKTRIIPVVMSVKFGLSHKGRTGGGITERYSAGPRAG
jgi:hypothetical protein